jgi:type IV pilus assembly protein PilV
MLLNGEIVMTRQKIPSNRFAHIGKPAQQGVVLLEALVAILLFSMGVLALVGLQTTMVKNTSDAQYRAVASYIAQQRIGMIWSDPVNAASYIEASTDISALLPQGLRATAAGPNANEFVVTVSWLQPGQGQTRHTFTTTATIAGG